MSNSGDLEPQSKIINESNIRNYKIFLYNIRTYANPEFVLKFKYLQNDSRFVDITGSTVVDKANISCIDVINMTINSEFGMYERAPSSDRPGGE